MVASAGLWPLSSPLAGQKRPLILPSGRFLLSGSRERPFPRPRVSSAASPDMTMSEPCPLAPVDVIGGGLAGSEAAGQTAWQHAPVAPHEIRTWRTPGASHQR
jgi:hypothetical protein